MSEPQISRFLASTPEGLLEFGIGGDCLRIERSKLSPDPGPISFLAPTGNGIIACGDGPAGQNGRVYSFRQTAPFETLERVSDRSCEGVTPCFLSLNAKRNQVAVCNFRSRDGRDSRGSVVILPLDANGVLGPVGRRFEFPGGGPKLLRQAASHPHSAAFTSSPDRLRVADLGTDSLWSVMLTNEHSEEPLRQPLRPGSGPRHLVVVKNGHDIFVNTEMSNELMWYQSQDGIEGAEGLREVARASLLPEGKRSAAAADLHISPDFRFLYSSLRGLDLITVFRVDLKAQTLAPVGHFQTVGQGPRTIAISADGSFLIVANTGTRSLNLFRRDLESGALTPLPLVLPSAANVIAC
jgi:6-phosphogluconolactonase